MKMPHEVTALFNDKEAVKVLTTVSPEGIPHTIVVGSAMAPDESTICAAEILMKTSSANLKSNAPVSVLAAKGAVSYQVVARVQERQTEGALFDKINAEMEKKGLSCRGVWLFAPVEAFDQSAGPHAGKKIA